jgi:hypothetical protein
VFRVAFFQFEFLSSDAARLVDRAQAGRLCHIQQSLAARISLELKM